MDIFHNSRTNRARFLDPLDPRAVHLIPVSVNGRIRHRVSAWAPQILLGVSLILTLTSGFLAVRVAMTQRVTASMLRTNESLPPDVRRQAAAFLASESITAQSRAMVLQLIVSFALILVAVHQIRRQSALARMRTDFVSSVSHELRTPLAQVQLFLETLRLGRFRTDAEREWIFDNMQREMTRLTALVSNVLQFSRIERGGMSALSSGARKTHLAPYLDDIVASFTPLAEVHSMRLETSFAEGIEVSIQADAFRQVMLNLLDNAVKYGPHGQTIRIEAAREGDLVRISVEDEGEGIPAGDVERIWNPFQRGSNALSTVAVGAGIGLSVVRDVVMAHGGKVSVERSRSGGAGFIVMLPGIT